MEKLIAAFEEAWELTINEYTKPARKVPTRRYPRIPRELKQEMIEQIEKWDYLPSPTCLADFFGISRGQAKGLFRELKEMRGFRKFRKFYINKIKERAFKRTFKRGELYERALKSLKFMFK